VLAGIGWRCEVRGQRPVGARRRRHGAAPALTRTRTP
jgi:hypothetical protein